MNLTNLFNLKFLKENIKRSKAIILLLIFLIPVINTIIYLMAATNSRTFVPTIVELTPLSLVGMYIAPIILSITLFSFIYKRKSSDFVMSMPISKKQIFISNTIAGIAIIILTNLVNYLFLLISTLLLNNVLVDYKMLFDSFLLWTTSYIFVFTCTNIAVSVSSNKITTVAVTLLILFLVPFVHTYITSNSFKGFNQGNISTYCNNESCRPKNYECYDTSCEINRKKDIYVMTYYNEIDKNTNYTIPFTIIKYGLTGENLNISYTSILKMAFLSVIYIIIGIVLFIRRKFEVVETSFKSERVHIFIRSLTTIPFLCFYYIILKNSSISYSDIFTVAFLFAIIMTYIIIYDLLTRKKVTNIFKSLASLIIVGIIVIFTGEISTKEIEYIDVNDITKMTFENTYSANTNGYINNKDIINYVMSIHMDNKSKDFYTGMTVQISVKDENYRFRISVTEEEYNYIINAINNDETYQKTSEKIKEKDIFAIEANKDSSYIPKESELYKKIVQEFKNNKDIITDQDENSIFTTSLYIYDNFITKTINYRIEENSTLAKEIIEHYNLETKKAFENPNINVIAYHLGVIIDNGKIEEQYLSSYNYNYQELDKFIIDNLDEKIDITKPYIYISLYVSNIDKNSYIFITNKVEELLTLTKEIKTNEEEAEFKTGDTYDKYTY